MTPERMSSIRDYLAGIPSEFEGTSDALKSVALELLSALDEGHAREVKLAERLRGASVGYHSFNFNGGHPGFWEECTHDTCTGDRAVLTPQLNRSGR